MEEDERRRTEREQASIRKRIDSDRPKAVLRDMGWQRPEDLPRPPWWKRALNSKFGRMALVSLGFHLPLTPQGKALYDRVVGHAEEVRERWNRPNAVIHPQSKENQQQAMQWRQERAKRSVPGAETSYKQEMRQKMESGESVSFRRLYFDLERLNGIPQDEVRQAEERADARINEFAPLIADGLDDQDARMIVGRMYGAADNYDFGQASVSRYFNSGKRNCVSVAKGELIVVEGLIERMPPGMKERYQLGLNIIKQHQVGTLTIAEGGRPDRTFFLEPPMKELDGIREEAGSKTVDLTTLKQGLVADRPLTLEAKKGKPGEIQESPRIDVLTDQPVSDGIVISGDLKGSDFVRRYAEEHGIVPEDEGYQPTPGMMEVEIWREKEGDPGPVEAEKRRKHFSDFFKLPSFDALDYTNPSVDSIRGFDWGPAAPMMIQNILFPDVTHWDPKAIDAMLMLKTMELTIETDEQNRVPEKFIRALESRMRYRMKQMGDFGMLFDELRIRLRDPQAHIPLDQLGRLLTALETYQETAGYPKSIGLRYDRLSMEEAKMISLHRGIPIHLMNLPTPKSSEQKKELKSILAQLAAGRVIIYYRDEYQMTISGQELVIFFRPGQEAYPYAYPDFPNMPLIELRHFRDICEAELHGYQSKPMDDRFERLRREIAFVRRFISYSERNEDIGGGNMKYELIKQWRDYTRHGKMPELPVQRKIPKPHPNPSKGR